MRKTTHEPRPDAGSAAQDAAKPLSPAAERALAEAAARRSEGQNTAPVAPETGGRAGPEPTRFGDWEKDGRTYDF